MLKPKYNLHFYIVMICLLLLNLFIFSACDTHTNSSTDDETGTWVEFKNLESFPVTVYSDPGRQQALTVIDAKSNKKIATTPNIVGIAFYPTFSINIPFIEEAVIPYNGPAIITAIEENKTTQVSIPKLELIEINIAYIKLKNDSDYFLSLRHGNAELSPLGARPSIIASGQSAAYEINPGHVSTYSFMRNTTIPLAYPSGIDEFEPGKVYSFTYNGTNLAQPVILPIPSPGWPSEPENIHAEMVSTTTVRLSWDNIYDADSYRIYRATGSATASYTQIATSTVNYYIYNGLASNQIYHYKICAVKDGNEGKQSEIVSVSTYTPPTNLRTFGRTDTLIFLQWSTVSWANSYNIYRSDSQTGTYAKVGTCFIEPPYFTTPAFSDHGLLPDTTYYYKVSAINNGAESMLSNPISVTTLSPVNIWVSSSSTTNISLAWDTINGARYSIYRSTSKDGTYTELKNQIITNEYTDADVFPYMTYYYSIGVYFEQATNQWFGTRSAMEISVTTED